MMKQNTKRIASQAGMTLVELLVALTISLVLLAGIYQVFIGSTQTYAVTDRLSRLQENGRFMTDYLRREVRMAGFMGCAQDVTEYTNTLNSGGDFIFNFNEAIYGLEATGTNTWADSGGNVDPTATGSNGMGLTNPVSGSDILVLRGVDPGPPVIVEGNPSGQTPTTTADMKVTDGTPGIADNDILMVSDCQHASVFQVTNYTQTNGNTVHNTGGTPAFGDADYPGNATKDLGNIVLAGAEIFKPRTVTYYIRNNGTGVPSLYRKINLANVEELVEGVEHMQVRYGVDTDGDRTVDQYSNANAIGDWNDVYSVRVGVVLRSVEEMGKWDLDTNTYDADGNGVAEYNPTDDRRLRMVMHMTSGLRNRLR